VNIITYVTVFHTGKAEPCVRRPQAEPGSEKRASYYKSMVYNLRSINKNVGHLKAVELKQVDLENHQMRRRKANGMSLSYIDQEIGALRRAIRKAADNDKISYDALRAFRNLSNLLPKK